MGALTTLKRIIILISGNGSNLQALINAKLPMQITAVISNNPNVYGLQRAQNAGIPIICEPFQSHTSAEHYEHTLLNILTQQQPDFIILAGFMRTLGPSIVRKFYGQIINLHPSLLPAYPGMHTHERVLAAGETWHGATVHFVNEQLDSGPIISQARFKVCKQDTIDTLKEKTQKLEHYLYPQAVSWLLQERLQLINNQVLLDHIPLPKTGKKQSSIQAASQNP